MALTFQSIHGSLFIDEDGSGGSRWAPSQTFLIFSTREHTYRYAQAGLRYCDSSESHLEHRHPFRKDYIDICTLHHSGLLPSQQRENVTEDSSHDNVVRTNMIPALKLQLQRVWHMFRLNVYRRHP